MITLIVAIYTITQIVNGFPPDYRSSEPLGEFCSSTPQPDPVVSQRNVSVIVGNSTQWRSENTTEYPLWEARVCYTDDDVAGGGRGA
jgi:hypothetical protein